MTQAELVLFGIAWFIAGFIACLFCFGSMYKKEIESGLITWKGKVYKLVEVQP